jgi:hypothetical protein
MWQVDNRTPFAAERGWIRDRNGAEVWLVAVKCTFDVSSDGTTTIARKQPPVLRGPEFSGEPGASSIKYEADLVLTKTTTDVVMVGHAYAPDGRPVAQTDVGLRVGPVQKVLRVVGERIYRASGPTSPEPFSRMPIVYERAFGGVDRSSRHPERDWDARNPVGTGFAAERDHAVGVRVPNIEYPDQLIRSWNDRPVPAGFGVVASHWQPRAALAGNYNDKWLKERQPLLAEDLDDRFFQCVPPDQQAPSFLRGGEPVVLYRLTPEGTLRFDLPRVELRFETHFYTGPPELHRSASLHTVILEPDHPRVSLVWHSALPCHFRVQKLERTVVTVRRPVKAADRTRHVEMHELV